MKSLEGWIRKRINSVLLPQKTRAFSSPSNNILMMSALSLQIDVMVVHHLPQVCLDWLGQEQLLILPNTRTKQKPYPLFRFHALSSPKQRQSDFAPFNRRVYQKHPLWIARYVCMLYYIPIERLDPLKWNSNMQWGTEGTRMNHWFNDACWPIPIEDT